MTTPFSFARSFRVVAAALVLALLIPASASAQDGKNSGTSMFITYRCQAANRPAFLHALEADAVKRFDEWKRTGVIADYILLYNQFVDALTWDAMVIISFSDYMQTDRWRAVERDNPGGLSADLLKLASPYTTYLADRIIYNGAPGDRSKSIFLVIPYQYKDKAEYVNYIKSYGVPQFDGWIREGVISSYGIFLNHHATGEPWDALLLFEYNGVEGLAQRDVAKQKIRAELAKNPSWKLLQDSKHEFRTELEVVMAGVVQDVTK